MSGDLPRVTKDAQRARLALVHAVNRMARLHRYSTGVQLNDSAKAVVMAINDFWRERDENRKQEFAREMCRRVDVKNYFPSIDRRKQWEMMRARMERGGMSEPLRRAVHALLTWPISRTGVNYACSEAERNAVPAHKRLENSPPGCGLAIGNYPSQTCANIYLDSFDQFVKHELRAQRYVRYVDDFILVHHDREQLLSWHREIVRFLREELRLELKPPRLARLSSGIDFLGYVVFPTHVVTRRRVVGHCRAKLSAWERKHCRGGRLKASRQAREQILSVWHSYRGHFSHANSFKLQRTLLSRFPWIKRLQGTN